jgi:hypothetical protein
MLRAGDTDPAIGVHFMRRGGREKTNGFPAAQIAPVIASVDAQRDC